MVLDRQPHAGPRLRLSPLYPLEALRDAVAAPVVELLIALARPEKVALA